MDGCSGGHEALEDREAPLAALRQAAGATAAERVGRLVLVTGAAGIGKSRLLSAFAAEARAAGDELLRAAGSEHESSFAHGLTRRLLERRLVTAVEAERESLLDGAAGLAWPLFAPASRSGPVPVEPALLHGLHWLVANLAEAAPLVLLVDDVQWADEPSLRFLLYIAQRLEDLPLCLVLGLRTGDPDAERPPVEHLLNHPAAQVLSLAPLGAAAVARIVRRRLGGADPVFAGACAELSAGNPFLLTELLRACEDDRVTPRADEVPRLHRVAPDNVRRAVVARLSRLRDPAAAVARAVAVLGPDATMHRAARVARHDADAAARAVDALVAAEILAAGEPLGFAHPLTRSAVYADVPFGERARAHARAAEALRDDGEAAERVAAHILLTPGSGQAWRVEVLRAAARTTAARGAPETAAAHLARALAEPSPACERRDVLIELGEAELRALAPDAVEHLRAALDLTTDPVARVDVQVVIGRALRAAGKGRDAALVLRDAAESLGPEHAERAERLRCEYLGEAMLDDALAATAWAEVGERVAAHGGVWTDADRPLLAQFALSTVVSNGDRAAGLHAARRLLAEPGYLERETTESQMYWMAVASLSWGDDIEEAERHCDAAVEDSVRRGSMLGFAWASYARSWPRYWRGQLAGAEADAETAADIWTGESGMYLPAAVAWLAHARMDRGELDAAAAAIERMADAAPVPTPQHVLLRWARVRCARLRGRAAEGLADIDAIAASPAASSFVNPGTCPWRSEGARAALATGDRQLARELAGEELTLARAFGAPRQIGIALRVAGLAEGGAAGFALLTEAVSVLAGHPARLEYLHALVLLGGAERRAGRRAAARDTLRAATALADELGAVLLAGEAREELIAAGGRAVHRQRHGVRGLTPSEQRVASHAARGLSNREIAQALFVTRKTVEHHLSSAYTKLAISSRRELAAALETPSSQAGGSLRRASG
jgi:DNA-binding CsgD family transcriptional regulator